MRRDERPADVQLIVGATGSGKSWYTKREALRWRARVIVWDWKREYGGIAPAVDLAGLARRGLHERSLRYEPRFADVDKQFAAFCQIAYTIQLEDPRTDCLLIVEEAQRVTRPGVAAPEWWLTIVEIGRVYGFSVRCVSPRPAYVDMGTRSAATLVRCGRLGEEDDAKAIGRRIGVPHGDIQRLPDRWAYVFNGRETKLFNDRGRVVPHVRMKEG